ncbi:PR domain-containing protein [Pimephales promelas]|nr:PR domain-containing protein [Pimephales promelas]
MKRTLTDFFCTPSHKVTKNPGVGDVGDVVNVDPPAEKKSYSFRREWLKDFEWLRYADGSMYCAHCKACGTEFAELNVKFNTAYTIAKEELAFTKFKPMLQLMKKNGVVINMTYANEKSCANIIGVIADTIRENTAVQVSSAQYISFIIDRDTDLSVKECVIVYVRVLLDGQPTNILVGHVEVEHANADGIYAATKSAFAGLGESRLDWLQKTVAMGADGAAVNLGRKGGVSTKLQEDAGKHIIPFHCMPHRMELALLAAQKDSPWVGNVYNLLHLIWKTYHFSSKSRRELKRLGVELNVLVNNPSGVKGTRWLSHVSRALDVLLKQEKEGTLEDAGQYTAVFAHMDHLAASSMNADIAGRAKHVKETMEDGSFLAFCHFLADLFSAISKYSLLLQRNDVILPQGVPLRKGEAGNMATDGLISQTAPRLQKQIETTVAAISLRVTSEVTEIGGLCHHANFKLSSSALRKSEPPSLTSFFFFFFWGSDFDTGLPRYTGKHIPEGTCYQLPTEGRTYENTYGHKEHIWNHWSTNRRWLLISAPGVADGLPREDTCSERLTVDNTHETVTMGEPYAWRHLASIQSHSSGARIVGAGGLKTSMEELRKYRTYPVRGVEWRASEDT